MSCHDFDALLAKIAKLARTPGAATSSGPPTEIAHDPLSAQVVDREEARLGVRLPHLLKRLHTEIGNGGFGPGYGLLTLSPLSPTDRSVSFFYGQFRAARNREDAEWPASILPFNDWGDLILSCLDLTGDTDDPPVIRFEPNMSKTDTLTHLSGRTFKGTGMIPECNALSIWLECWIKGEEMFGRPYAARGQAKR